MDTLSRSYKYRFYPTQAQEKMLSDWQFACWQVQRATIIQRRAAWEKYRISNQGKLPGWASQGREVTELRKEYPALADVPADTMSAIVKRVDVAYAKMRKDRKAGIDAQVRWADKPEHVGLVFRGEERGTKITTESNKFGFWRLAGAGKLGLLKIRMHRAIPEGAEIKQAHITRGALGWFVSFSCVIPAPAHLPPAKREVNGVDLGCIHDGDIQRIAAVDDGRVYQAPDHLKKEQDRLATLQKLASHNRKVHKNAKSADSKSKRTQKRREKIAKLQARIARQREHQQQYIAKRLVESANVTAFEDVSWGSLRKQGKPREIGDNRPGGRKSKKGLNRSMASASPARLVQLANEKAEATGRQIVKVDARNTSQACSGCGVIGERKGLGVREWTCQSCGAQHDRDINAARNIANRARSKLEIQETLVLLAAD